MKILIKINWVKILLIIRSNLGVSALLTRSQMKVSLSENASGEIENSRAGVTAQGSVAIKVKRNQGVTGRIYGDRLHHVYMLMSGSQTLL